MAASEPGQQPSLTALPRLEDLPRSGDGYDPDKVREAFEAFRRHSAQLQAQLRVLQAAAKVAEFKALSRVGLPEPEGWRALPLEEHAKLAASFARVSATAPEGSPVGD